MTYGSLFQEASAYARLFVQRGLRPGSMVFLLAPSVRAFVSAFLGVQQAGLVAIPAPSPEPLDQGTRYRNRLLEIVTRPQARAVFAPLETPLDELEPVLAAQGVPLLTPTTLSEVAGNHTTPSAYCGIAHCQFTSGSGGRAKGVLLAHENVPANIRQRTTAYDLGQDEVMLTWLPFSHDMALVGYVLHPLAMGTPCHIMSPYDRVAPSPSRIARPNSTNNCAFGQDSERQPAQTRAALGPIRTGK